MLVGESATETDVNGERERELVGIFFCVCYLSGSNVGSLLLESRRIEFLIFKNCWFTFTNKWKEFVCAWMLYGLLGHEGTFGCCWKANESSYFYLLNADWIRRYLELDYTALLRNVWGIWSHELNCDVCLCQWETIFVWKLKRILVSTFYSKSHFYSFLV